LLERVQGNKKNSDEAAGFEFVLGFLNGSPTEGR
jgi:hypothetical protein